jgi:MtN3 and saliva related transmembrane protein
MDGIDQSTLFGVVASSLTTLSLLPQLRKLVKEKKSDDISLFMLFILLAGFACWVYYGFLKQDYIIIVANSISLILNGTIVVLSILYKNED